MSKVALQGNVSGTGTFTLASPNSSTDRTLDLPDASGVIDRLNRAGNVLQVVTYTDGTQTTTTSTSYVATALAASITPFSASNKILIVTSQTFDAQAADREIRITLYRGATNLETSSNVGFATFYEPAGRLIVPGGISYLDSPNTTSSVTYTVYFRSPGGGSVRTPPSSGQVQSITLMEIAG